MTDQAPAVNANESMPKSSSVFHFLRTRQFSQFDRVPLVWSILALSLGASVLSALRQPIPAALIGIAISLALFCLVRAGFQSSSVKRDGTAKPVQDQRLKQIETVAGIGQYEIVVDLASGHQSQIWSEGMRMLLGRCGSDPASSVEDYVNRTVHAEDRHQVRATLERLLRDGGSSSCEYRVVRPDGATLYLYDWMQCDSDTAGRQLLYGFRYDLTKHRDADRERLSAATRFQALIDQLPGVPYLASLKKNCGTMYVSPRLESLLGFGTDEWAGNRDLRISRLHPQDRQRVLHAIAEAQASKSAFSIEYRIYHRNGNLLWLRDEARVITDAQNEAMFLQGVALDITERKQTQQALEQSRQRLHRMIAELETLREQEHKRLAQEMHDDFGQLLIAMKMDLVTLREHLPPGDYRLAQLAIGIDSLIGSMMTSMRRIIADLPPTDLDDNGLRNALELLTARFSKQHPVITCRLDIVEPMPPLHDAHSLPIYRLVQEALNNVAKHAHATRVDIRINCQHACLTIDIIDNGRGFAANNRCPPGSFGLIAMRERVAAMDGEIRIDSTPEMGTTLQITLPVKGGTSVESG